MNEYKLIDLIGECFGRWTVLYRAENHIRPSGQSIVRWHCICDCGNEKDVDGCELRNGSSKSCGCLQKELTIKRESGVNLYDLSGDYGIGYTMYNEPFYFDLEDYDKIKDFYWRISKDGYVNSKDYIFHRIVTECPVDKIVDHINSKKRNDNRKSNLRHCNQSENLSYKGIQSNNTSGIIGVSWSNKYNKWLVRLNKNHKCIYLEYFSNKEEAINARLSAEKKYFGKFAPQKYLYEQYGI